MANGNLRVEFLEEGLTCLCGKLIVIYDASNRDRLDADFAALSAMNEVQRAAAFAKMRLEQVIQPVTPPSEHAPGSIQFEPILVKNQPPASVTDVLLDFWLE